MTGVTPETAPNAVQMIIGKERFEAVRGAKLLVVGAGGIGCELLKNLVLTGFVNIEVVDLDTIDVSNLNRQFLFRRGHVDRPKAEVAAEAVRAFCPDAKIVAHHGNVKDAKFGIDFISRFDVVVNALDNLEARRHVNRLALAADKPLLEAGSTGHLGQVTVIQKGQTECFECQAKPTQKVYPYCTIRSTPEKPIHCLTWAKNLFDLCFGPDDESNLLSDLAEEMAEFRKVEVVDGDAVGKRIFDSLFNCDILKQAKLEDLWSDERPPPRPVTFAAATDEAREKDVTGAAVGGDETLLQAQKVPTVAADAHGFIAAVSTMYSPARRSMIGQSVFSKDDPVAMDFVHCAANMRMENYRIGRLSRWDAQSIAGAIIPAVASTNAIVAGLEVVQLMHVLDAQLAGKSIKDSRCRTVWVRYPEPSRKKILQPSTLSVPNKACFVCGASTARVVVKSMAEWKIAAWAKSCVQDAIGAHRPAIYANGSCIFDPEYAEPGPDAEEEGLHPEWSLTEWGLASGSLLQIEDEGQGFSCNVVVTEDPDLDEKEFPAGFQVVAAAGPSEVTADGKADKEEEPDAKRQKTAAAAVVDLE